MQDHSLTCGKHIPTEPGTADHPKAVRVYSRQVSLRVRVSCGPRMRHHGRVLAAAETTSPGGNLGASRIVTLGSAACVMALLVVACFKGDAERTATGTTAALGWESSYEAALARAAKLKRPVMVDFYTDWCGWCRRLDDTTLADGRVRRALEHFVLVKLDAEKEGSSAADHFGVRAYPTIVFLDASGNEVGRIPGYLEADGFLQEVEAVLKRT
jgi:thiol:disulfide interchange protein